LHFNYFYGDFSYLLLLLIVSCLASNLFPIVLQSVTVVMVLRVYAMWYQSKIIIRVLLCIYIPGVIIAFTFAGIYNTPGAYLSGVSQNELDVSMPSCLDGLNLASSDRHPDSQYVIVQWLRLPAIPKLVILDS
jgi:energy-coupling factor transporter transmembrane protein EcfT